MTRKKERRSSTSTKRKLPTEPPTLDTNQDRPAKKTKLLDDTDDESDGGDGVDKSFKVNEEYARRFEHNKQREEKHRLEEKYGKGKALEDDEDSEDSEEGVEEDDAGEFVTEALDADISATLQALRSKDPRIYDSNVKFFRDEEHDDSAPTNGAAKEPSMTLKEYHTKNLLEGRFDDDDEEIPPKTYAQEQEEVRQNLLRETTRAGDCDEEDDFLVAKSRIEPPARTERIEVTAADVENADKDPENFLSNYMASRAWVPKGDTRFQPLESDDEDDEAAAEEYENSYNLYFEDTTDANEKLVTYARDAVAKTTVRRDAQSSRAKAREAARAKREAERKQREEELARLRKLKVDEIEQKVNKIREVGGLKGREFNVADWKDILEGDWSDDQWDKEMRKRFGESYYEETVADSGSDNEDTKSRKRRKPKKPKFDDDIDIQDLIPNFKDDDGKPDFALSSDDDEDENVEASAEEGDDETSSKTKQSAKQRKRERAEAKSAARRDRRLIENLVNESLQYEAAMATKIKKTAPTRFRYRETSPTSFGMTARDILLASDKQLNEFAGLKKLASFRDPAKKKKDRKHLSKKARLRQWRQETFGDAEGPKGGFEVLVGNEVPHGDNVLRDGVEGEGTKTKEAGAKKRKRKNKGKAKAE